MFVACLLSVGYGVIQVAPHLPRLQAAVAWIGGLIFLVTFPIAFARSSPWPILGVGVAAVVIESVAPSNTSYVASLATVGLAGGRLDDLPGRLVAGLTGVGFLVAGALAHALSPDGIASIASGLLFTYFGTVALRGLRVEKQRTESLLSEVLASREAQVRAAALDERARLAREMHDVLAHTLSALSLQLEGTRMLVEQRPTDAATLAAVERASSLAREGLLEARRAVGSLRGDSLPGPDLLPKLVQDFERDTGVPCTLRIEGEAVKLSAEARLTLYRAGQEALTNVRKHADASSVTMTLRYAADGVQLTVENHGAEKASGVEGGGHGLSGMRERAELVGGKLEAGPIPGGFVVCLWIPI